ncbi:MAG: RdgB/HAM1 family non-canonical purine NTP pyrophosphatase [Alphaproteobacteria bacterium]
MSGRSQTHLSARLDGGPLVIASHNAGKIREIRTLVAPFDIKIVSAADLGLPEPDETGATFAENAILKAEAAANATGHAALSDDSGLAVAALDGEPGIHSARWAGPDGDFARAMRNVEEQLQAAGATTAQDRGAAFVCVLALIFPGGEPELFEGRIEGTLVWPPRGGKGFGYDPMFLPEGKSQTFGEMEAADKHGWARAGETGLSHRARAFARFADQCLTRDG